MAFWKHQNRSTVRGLIVLKYRSAYTNIGLIDIKGASLTFCCNVRIKNKTFDDTLRCQTSVFLAVYTAILRLSVQD